MTEQINRRKAWLTLAVALAFALFAVAPTVTSAAAQPHRDHGAGDAPTVVNGRPVRPFEFPTLAGLALDRFDGSDRAFCGATLIDAEWALTAAHCLAPSDLVPERSSLKVLIGAWALPLKLGTRHTVCGGAIHPDFDEDTLGNDIAVLRLCVPHHHPTAKLPDSEALEPAGAAVETVGWGELTNERVPEQPFAASITVLSQQVCSDPANLALVKFPYSPDSNLCAGDRIDACSGDSGGPLYVENTVIGITSFGDYPCEQLAPGYYTRVSAFTSWITAETGIGVGVALPGVPCGGAYASIVGTAGDDVIVTGDRGEVVVGGDGDDLIITGDGIDIVCGGPGDDLIGLGDGIYDRADGEAGNDTIFGQGGDDQITGGDGDDRLRGGSGADFVAGGDGNDNVYGGAGDDDVRGGAGVDKLRGGAGDDSVDGGADDDDLVAGNGGDDRVLGGPGNDRLVTGGPGADAVSGGPGDDRIKGGPGADVLAGDDGNDDLFGGSGVDSINGGAGDDFCSGGTNTIGVIGADAVAECERVINLTR